jgi:hypothetical protein
MKTTAILIVVALITLVLVAGCTSNQGGTDTTDTGSQGTGDTGSDNTDFASALEDFANSMDTVDDTNSDLGDFTTEDSNTPST